MAEIWQEVGDKVFVRRYRFYDQDIGLLLGRDAALVIDTRISHRQADEILADIRTLTSIPVTHVVNTHFHWDHTFGNHRFRPATIWGHERCAAMLRATFDEQRQHVLSEMPELADEIAEVELDPPDQTLTERATLDVGGREVELRYLGLGHTDNDVVVIVPDAEVIFAGDLLENGGPPYFGNGYPIDWPATAEALLALTRAPTVVVPGHGDVAGQGFVKTSLASFREVSDLARRVHTDGPTIEEVLPDAPWGGGPLIREALERGLAQLRGEL